jgi:monoamine oxidase
MLQTGPVPNALYDITIVGAGMSGLYAASRLTSPAAQDSPLIKQLIAQNGTGQLNLCMLEFSDRVGGRLDTFTFTESNGVKIPVELGGMRFQKSHQLVWQLVQNLGLSIQPFGETSNRLFYLRGTHIWESEISNTAPGAIQVPYRLAPEERYLTPDQVFNNAVSIAVNDWGAPNWSAEVWREKLQQLTYTSPEYWEVGVYKNASFYDVGFWNLLFDQLSNEGYRYVTEAGGYDSNTINWNSGAAMPYVASGDYGPNAVYQQIVGGYGMLPAALLAQLTNVPIFLDSRLQGFTNDGPDGALNCTVLNSRSGQQTQFQSKYLMLCMPKRSLELLDPDTPFRTAIATPQLLNSVIAQPSFKLYLVFDTPWWQQFDLRDNKITPYGPTITDLPLRMIWYFVNPSTEGQYWALLASYSDMASEQFWNGLEKPLAGGRPGSGHLPPTSEMVKMALSQLQQVHGFSIPQPVAAVFEDWGLDPYGAGYHAWATRNDPYKQSAAMLNPVPGFNVFVCGEAYSLDQGWVEGALRTAETVLTQYLQLPPLPITGTGKPA